MKPKQLETVLILFFSGLLLALYSYYRPEISMTFLKGETVNFDFIPFDKMLTLNLKNNHNAKADSLTDKLLAQTKVDTVAVKKKTPEKEEEMPFLSLPNSNGEIGPLDDFFSALMLDAPKKVVRIAHYGDSQIEGDRISSNLRAKFVREFGGEGVGFIPFQDIAESVTYTRTSSKNWKRFTVFHDKLKKGNFGLSGMSFVYMKHGSEEMVESIEEGTENIEVENPVEKTEVAENTTLNISLRNRYSHLSIQYGNADSPCKVTVCKRGKNEVLGKTVLQSKEEYNNQEIPLSSAERQISLTFKGKSPMFYGLTVDGDNGVQVDNYGIRGHSGNGLMKINKELLSKEVAQSNTRLLILQFGANTIPYVKDGKTLNYIAQEFSKLFKKFKGANRNISILVIGVGDMATRIDGEYTSYPMIPQIRDVLKKSALDAGCAYFDLYEYMGGKDAILSWSKKGLASKDGHFSPQGQEIVADEIFKVLLNNFNLFKQKYHLNS
jgi:lysophospholipase L1-like esterase